MSDETGFASAADVQREARASLDLSAVVEAAAAGDTGESAPASEPGPDAAQTATPEPEPQPATPAGGDLQSTGGTAARVAEPAAAAAAPPTPKPVTAQIPSEAQMPIEDVKITPDGIQQTLQQLMDERRDVRARVDELDAQRAVIARDQEELARLQKSLAEIESVTRENETLKKHYKALAQKKPDDFEIKESLREIEGLLIESYGQRANNKIEQRDLADRIDRATRGFTAGIEQIRNFTITVMKSGVEEQRAKQQETAAFARESKDWESAFAKVWSEAKLPGEIREKVNRYLASFGGMNIEIFKDKSYEQFMREHIGDVAGIYSHGRDTAVASYADAKRADAKQSVPKLKPSTGGTETPEPQSPIEKAQEIQRQARASIKERIGATT
jgi:BMFP domain-containing protein YqiC